ncbi:MAG: hypothetical protein ABI573_06125 [Chloroflexota bacterium]
MTESRGPAVVSIEPEQLARIHLRVGSLQLARAELEALVAVGSISTAGLADLAETRWRGGDLEAAAVAAADHQAAGGLEPVALVILAEWAAVDGRPDEAEKHVTALVSLTEASLSALYAGMPRRANWPSVGAAESVDAPPVEGPVKSRRGRAASSRPAATAETPGNAGEPASKVRSESGQMTAFPDGESLLREARADMRSSEPERMGLAFDRLALALRWHPSVAPDVVELVARRGEPGALLVRGDALRSLGRLLEAEAAYAAAAAALGAQGRRPG